MSIIIIYQNNQFYIVKIEFLKFSFFGTLAWTIELYMTKYIISEIFSSGGATLYKNPSDQTVEAGQWPKRFQQWPLHQN